MSHKIVVIGIGYVGLVSGACLSELGHTITCLDIDERKISALQEGILPIYEPGIDDLVQKNIQAERLFFTTSYEEAFSNASSLVILVAVDTPTGPCGKCDVSRIEAVCQTIGKKVTVDTLVVIKSTVPVGTSKKAEQHIQDELINRRDRNAATLKIVVDVVSNPEFLREGAALHDFMHAERVIVGTNNERSEFILRNLYEPLLKKNPKTQFLCMDTESSELTKYAANAMLALRISFMNWLSQIATACGANIDHIRCGIGSDRRIGASFLQAGLGFGGSCFPKDIKALRSIAHELHVSSDLIDAIDAINQFQRDNFAKQVLSYIYTNRNSDICDCRIGIWGLAFKPNTDDMRQAPSLDIIRSFLDADIAVQLFDPIATANAQKILCAASWYKPEKVHWCATPLEAAFNVDALLLVTEWDMFLHIDKSAVKNTMKGDAFFDGRNLFSAHEMAQYGFCYFSIGRPSIPLCS